ncbi:Enolase [Scedosporium apiospermum]|uniref:Enolase n=1 Tax=Pseudallescheria apiosperma TaxID=563466 RepID=A0A084G9L1_PSEDA|nr:Enolase [Scedosporium apiospermum]KEZ44023.1 Enolase [Scedosporium apiospermum]
MITAVRASQRLDSRGNPTIQVDVKTSKGWFRSLVPSGASTGLHEAVELRDKIKSVYGGKGVETAVKNVQDVIGPALIEKGFDVRTQLKEIDQFMRKLDGTPNKARLGANAILGVSMACARAGAAEKGVPLYEFLRGEAGVEGPFVLPVPFLNVLNGGVHSGNKMAFQEFMIAPVGATSFEESIRIGCEVYHRLKEVITAKHGPTATGVGDEEGFAPPIVLPQQALDLLETAVADCGYTGKVKFAIDPASSEFFRDGLYDLGFKQETRNVLTPPGLGELYHQLIYQYPVVLLEDPFAEEDGDSWTEFNKTCKIELVGDDLLVTNVERLRIAREKKACNSMLLKVNQIGTVSEAIAAANLATSFGWSIFVSHRSGETTDDFIADLTVGLGTGHLKSGAPCRGERTAKYNRLMDIESELKATGKPYQYAGENFRFPQNL